MATSDLFLKPSSERLLQSAEVRPAEFIKHDRFAVDDCGSDA